MSISQFGFDSLSLFNKRYMTILLENPKSSIFILSPTSSGKSLCFQYPGLVFDGVTVVISPLNL